jgi:hypothetical protein
MDENGVNFNAHNQLRSNLVEQDPMLISEGVYPRLKIL